MTARLVITISYFLSTTLSYALMLVVMTFNGGLFIATCLGLSFGYFLFGYLKKKSMHEVKEAVGGEKMYNPEGDKCCADVDFD
jgi:Ctr copper transporter family